MASRSGIPSLPRWNIKEIGNAMRAQLCTVDSGGERVGGHTKCFRGSDAVDWMKATGIANTEEEALKMGNIMLASGVFSEIRGGHLFRNKAHFYRFAEDEFDRIVLKEGISNVKLAAFVYFYLSQLATCMRCEVVLVDKGFFTGYAGCAWLRKVGIAKAEEEAVGIVNALLRAGILHHTARKKLFEPGTATYQFAIDSFREMAFKKAKSRSPAKKQNPCVGLDGILLTASEIYQVHGDVRWGRDLVIADPLTADVTHVRTDTTTYGNESSTGIPAPDSGIMDSLTSYITSISSAAYLFSDPAVTMMASPSKLADILAQDSGDEDVLDRVLNDVMGCKGSKRISNGSITSRSSLVEGSSHRIHNDDGGDKNAEHLILLNQTTSSNLNNKNKLSREIKYTNESKWNLNHVGTEFLRELQAFGDAFSSSPYRNGKSSSSCGMVHGYHPQMGHIFSTKELGRNEPIATLMAMDHTLSVKEDGIFMILPAGSS